ncbi:MAG: transcriptional regulator [Oscillospiraceae bacterium]|jgi:predicted transcriptional regulator of viral defense system|nr:transcriptional regulator [Oscillospiraceae bacterium]
MKHYEQLLKMGCFTWDELCGVIGNQNTADSLARSYQKKGYIQSVKRGLYVAVDLATGEPAVSKYRIASKLTQSSYVSHHAAFEYYGCANQVSYQVEVSSRIPFAPFRFNGTTYAYISSRLQDSEVTRLGSVITQPDRVRVTDMERTVLDGINDFEKIMGLEELLRCLELIPAVKEEKLLAYLDAYGKQVMYQKTGYILGHFRDVWNLSDGFFSACESRIGKSKRYFYKPSAYQEIEYDSRWRLVIPPNLMSITNKGVSYDADV